MFKLLGINEFFFIKKVLKFLNIMVLVETRLYVIPGFVLRALIRDIIHVLFTEWPLITPLIKPKGFIFKLLENLDNNDDNNPNNNLKKKDLRNKYRYYFLKKIIYIRFL